MLKRTFFKSMEKFIKIHRLLGRVGSRASDILPRLSSENFWTPSIFKAGPRADLGISSRNIRRMSIGAGGRRGGAANEGRPDAFERRG
jgi:hypothetical protein